VRGVIIAATAGFALVVTLCNATEWIQVVQNISYGDPGQFVDENLQRFSIMASWPIARVGCVGHSDDVER